MKKLFFAIVTILFTNPFFAQNGIVKVTVTGIENTNGFIQIGIYSNKETFPIFGKEIQGAELKPTTKGSLDYTFKNLKTGNYAIAIWHDENKNHKIDKNFFGAPKEKYGFSKNIYGTFGPPNFEKVSFTVTNDKIVNLTINIE